MTYKVKDKAGNEAKITRKIVVKKENVIPPTIEPPVTEQPEVEVPSTQEPEVQTPVTQ